MFSVGTISWAILLAGIALMAAIILTPAIRDVNQAERTRNDYQATLKLLDQKIQLQKDFTDAAAKDPVLMERLASRGLNLNRKDQDILILEKPPTSDEIAAKAKAIWEASGRPKGRDQEFRRQAELELRAQANDRSVRKLLAESLTPVAVEQPKAVNPLLALTLNSGLRPMLIILACTAIALSFFVGVKYQRD
ncbi:MAG TPA: DUF2934 domain-containing protein [Phycisphaerae bacterium]|nr:DUF2934 domain-containing protein [Phycisphaerae bacterium]